MQMGEGGPSVKSGLRLVFTRQYKRALELLMRSDGTAISTSLCSFRLFT